MPQQVRFWQASGFEELPHVVLRFDRQATGIGEAVENDVERALRYDLWIEQLQRARSGVARIGKERFTGFLTLLVELGEARLRHEDLATHLEGLRAVLRKPQRQRLDRLEVVRHVIPCGAIATRDAMFEHAILVTHADGHAVHLRLNDALHLLATEAFLHAGKEGGELLLRVGVVEAHHPHRVRDLRETFQRRSTHALRRRIRREQIGKLRLDLLEFTQQPVEVLVRDHRPGLDVVEAVVAVQFGTEKGGAAGGFGVGHGEGVKRSRDGQDGQGGGS